MSPDELQGFSPLVNFEDSFDAVYGLEFAEDDPDEPDVARGRVPIRSALLGLSGAVHGGVLAAAAEAVASRATAIAVIPHGSMAQGMSNDTSVTAPVSEGAIHVEARAVSRADDAWIWAVEHRDDAGELCGFSRITVAVRPLRRG
jgi:uncharacterized protein (TIGR00369 family)